MNQTIKEEVKYKALDYVLMTIFFMLSSSANAISMSFYVYIFVALLLGLKVHAQEKVNLNFIVGIGFILFLYVLDILIVFGQFPAIGSIARVLGSMTLAFYFALYFKNDFIDLFERVLFLLVALSLFFYFFVIVFPNTTFDYFTTIQNNIGSHLSEDVVYAKYVNIFVYTINDMYQDSLLFQHRNSGFGVEPGYFSIFVVLGILFSLHKNSYVFKPRLIIYLIALISTESTTGLLLLIVVLFIYFIQKKSNTKFVLWPFLVVVIILIINSPIVLHKISALISNTEDASHYQRMALKDRSVTVSMGRFTSFVYIFEHVLKENIVCGYFGIDDALFKGNLSYANGLATILLRFGVLGVLLVLTGFYYSSTILFPDFKLGTRILFTIFAIIALFGFPLTSSILFWYLVSLGFIFKKRQIFAIENE